MKLINIAMKKMVQSAPLTLPRSSISLMVASQNLAKLQYFDYSVNIYRSSITSLNNVSLPTL